MLTVVRRIAYLASALLAMNVGNVATAETCVDLFDFMKTTASSSQGYIDSWTFQKEGRGDNILLLFKDKNGGAKGTVKHWAFLTRRQKDTTNFCILGEGESFGFLMDMHTNSSEKRFGLPGSNQPRCSSFNETLPGSLAVRMWANRELGESTILYTESKSTSGFQFLIASDDNWIIIENKKNDEKTACYYERGNRVLIKQDLVIAK